MLHTVASKQRTARENVDEKTPRYLTDIWAKVKIEVRLMFHLDGISTKHLIYAIKDCVEIIHSIQSWGDASRMISIRVAYTPQGMP